MSDSPPARILTVDIRTIQLNITSRILNNPNVLLELFAKVRGIADGRYILQSSDSSHTIMAVFHGKHPPVQIGDAVRCVGQLKEHISQFQVIKISKINYAESAVLINRLISISNAELAKLV